jgi:predicted transcriptional regulator
MISKKHRFAVWARPHYSHAVRKAVDDLNRAPQNVHDELILKAAHQLYRQGFNVIPQPYGRSTGFNYNRGARMSHALLDAAFAGMCNLAVLSGKTSNNLFSFECDTDGAFHETVAQFERRDWPVWAVKFPHGGHIWARSKDGEVRNPDSVIRNIIIRGNGGHLLCPPSMLGNSPLLWHRQDGDQPASISPADIDWLVDLQGARVDLVTKQSSEANTDVSPSTLYNPFGMTTQDFLATKSAPSDAEKNLRAAACDFAGLGFTIAEARQHLIQPALALGLSDELIGAALQWAFSESRPPARELNPDTKAALLPQYAKAYSRTRQWDGRKGNANQLVFDTLVQFLEQAPNRDGEIDASERRIAEAAHRDRNTVSRAIKRLKQEQLIEWAKVNYWAGGSNVYRFSSKILATGRKRLAESFVVDPLLQSDLHYFSGSISKDSALREYGGLNGNALRIYTLLLHGEIPMTGPQLEVALNLSTGKVSGALQKLKSMGMVTNHGKRKGYTGIVQPPEWLEYMARGKKLENRAWRREERHQGERAQRNGAFLIQYRIENDPYYPLHLQKIGRWLCPECKYAINAKPADRPTACPNCGTVNVVWKRMGRPKISRIRQTLDIPLSGT